MCCVRRDASYGRCWHWRVTSDVTNRDARFHGADVAPKSRARASRQMLSDSKKLATADPRRRLEAAAQVRTR